VNSEMNHPRCPSVIIEDQFDISKTTCEKVRDVLRNDTVYFPKLNSPSNTQIILPHQFLWRVIDLYLIVVNIEVRYEKFPIFSTAGSIIQHWKWIFKPLAGMLLSYSNFLAAKCILRWILRFGDFARVRRGPGDPWLTPRSLVLYWVVEYLIFRGLGIGRLSWVLGLWSCNSEESGMSLWAISGKEFLICLALRSVSGLLLGLLRVTSSE
jgi:hypothetical protein